VLIEDLYLMRREDAISLFIDDVLFAKVQFSFSPAYSLGDLLVVMYQQP
jgi:hypothetical protein